VLRVPRHRVQAHSRRRLLLGVAGGAAVAAIGLGAYYLAGPGSAPAVTAARAAAASGRTATSPAGRTATPAASSPAPSPPGKSVSPRPAGSRTPAPAPASPAAAPSAPVPATGTGVSSAAASVLALINQARASAGLPAYTILAGLQTSSGQHNMLMADGCGLSHQCPGEPALGARETAAGVHWTAAGENIGEGGPVGDTTAAITSMATALTQDMLNEKPPDDGHRLNLLSPSFTSIGIAVYRGSDGTVWMTQDFAN